MSLNAFKKVFIEATNLSHQSFIIRFDKLIKKHAKIGFAVLGAFGHIVENLVCPSSKSDIKAWDEEYKERYEGYLLFKKCTTDAVAMPTQLQKILGKTSNERNELMTKKYPELAEGYPSLFNDILSTFKFNKSQFVWKGDKKEEDKTYMEAQMAPLKALINAEFIDKLTKDALCIFEEAKTLKRLSDKARFKKLYDPHREFAKEHPIPFKYAVQNLEFCSKSFKKYAKRYMATGTNRGTTAELSAIYIMYMRGTTNLGEKDKAKVKANLMTEINRDMQEMDDFIKDFKESYKEKEERILQQQQDQLYKYLIDRQVSNGSDISVSVSEESS